MGDQEWDGWSLLGKERWRNKEQELMDKTRNEEDLSKKLDALPSEYWKTKVDAEKVLIGKACMLQRAECMLMLHPEFYSVFGECNMQHRL